MRKLIGTAVALLCSVIFVQSAAACTASGMMRDAVENRDTVEYDVVESVVTQTVPSRYLATPWSIEVAVGTVFAENTETRRSIFDDYDEIDAYVVDLSTVDGVLDLLGQRATGHGYGFDTVLEHASYHAWQLHDDLEAPDYWPEPEPDVWPDPDEDVETSTYAG